MTAILVNVDVVSTLVPFLDLLEVLSIASDLFDWPGFVLDARGSGRDGEIAVFMTSTDTPLVVPLSTHGPSIHPLDI